MSARDDYRDREIAALTVGRSEVVLERHAEGLVSLNVYDSDGALTDHEPFGVLSDYAAPSLAGEFAQAILRALPESEDRPEPGQEPEPEPSERAYTLREIEEAIDLVGGVNHYEGVDRLETALTALRALKGARS